jgi:hypothetical protein
MSLPSGPWGFLTITPPPVTKNCKLEIERACEGREGAHLSNVFIIFYLSTTFTLPIRMSHHPLVLLVVVCDLI